ncbi:MAG: hypothetical protein ABIJ09_24290 [Pseudomonadota bacterium]
MTKQSKHRCRHCGCHTARFEYRGRWKADRQHDLCPRCYRSTLDCVRSMALSRRRKAVQEHPLAQAA